MQDFGYFNTSGMKQIAMKSKMQPSIILASIKSFVTSFSL